MFQRTRSISFKYRNTHTNRFAFTESQFENHRNNTYYVPKSINKWTVLNDQFTNDRESRFEMNDYQIFKHRG